MNFKILIGIISSIISIFLIYHFIMIVNSCDCLSCDITCINNFEILMVIETLTGICIGFLIASLFDIKGILTLHLILVVITGILYCNLIAYFITLTPAEAMPWFKTFLDIEWAFLSLYVLVKKFGNNPIWVDNKRITKEINRFQYIFKLLLYGILAILMFYLFIDYFSSTDQTPNNTMIVTILFSSSSIFWGLFLGNLFKLNRIRIANLIMIFLILWNYVLIITT